MAQHLLGKAPRRSKNAENLFRGEPFSIRGALRDLIAAAQHLRDIVLIALVIHPWSASEVFMSRKVPPQ